MFEDQKGSSWDTNVNGVNNGLGVDNSEGEKKLIDLSCTSLVAPKVVRNSNPWDGGTIEIENDWGFAKYKTLQAT